MTTLYQAYRPQSFDEFFGNKDEINLLKEALEREEPPHSFFIKGPPGCGKTTLARIIGTELEVSPEDFHEYNNANNRGIDTIRQLDFESQFMPNQGKRKVYLADESHRMTIDAWNALLKLLEEAPKHVTFILATAEPEKITGTIKKAIDRRCYQVELRPLPPDEIKELLSSVILSEYPNMEENEIALHDKLISKITMLSEGSPGMALNYLDKVIDSLENENCLSLIEGVEEGSISGICSLILDDKINTATKWKKMRELLITLEGQNAESIKSGIMNYLKKVLLGNRVNAHEVAASAIADLQAAPIIYSGMAGLACVLYFICKDE